jgi:hypothetical protein
VTSDDTEAVKLLPRQPIAQVVSVVAKAVECRRAAGDVPELVRLVDAAGIAVYATSPRRSHRAVARFSRANLVPR